MAQAAQDERISRQAMNQELFDEIISFIRKTFNEKEGVIDLHRPYFIGNEKKYLADAIDSTFVSSVGAYVNRFEEMMRTITGAKYAVATMNGTTALHLALVVAGVKPGDSVITQPLTFAATANAIVHAGAAPVFLDVDTDTMGLSPTAVSEWLVANAEIKDGACFIKETGQRIAACVPMHTFGFLLRIKELADVCSAYHIRVVEDAAESLGSYVGDVHTGTFGSLGIFSFNGNKTVTSGGGGCIITNDDQLGPLAKHLSTTAKKPHPYEFEHDQVGYNYRMPNLNAALACAQLEQLEVFLKNKRDLAEIYRVFFASKGIPFVTERRGTTANYWLNTILLPEAGDKEAFLQYANKQKVSCRPVWRLMNRLPMYTAAITSDLINATMLEQKIVNLPSSFRP